MFLSEKGGFHHLCRLILFKNTKLKFLSLAAD